MKLIQKLILFLVLVSMTSCFTNIPLATQSSDNNRSYTVDYLFEHDGCKVYRFMDNGKYVYFTNCKSDITAMSSDSTQVVTKSTITVVK